VAKDALSRGAPKAAVSYLRRVADVTPRAELGPVLVDLGRAEAFAGADDAVRHLRQAIELSSEPLSAARASLTLGRTLKYSRPLEVCDVLETALATEPADQELRDALEIELLSLSFLSVDARERLRSRLDRLSEPDRPRNARDVFALASLAWDSIDACGRFDRAVSLIHRALAASSSSGAGNNGIAMCALAQALVMCERFDEADNIFATRRDLLRRRGFVIGYAGVLSVRSMLNYKRGALADAEADAAEALALAAQLGNPRTIVGYAENARNLVALERGDRHELERLIRESVAPIRADAPGSVLSSRGRLRAAIGDARGGLTDLLAVGEFERRWNTANPGWSGWRSDAALLVMGLGERQESCRLAEEELELARQFGAPRALGIALRAVALTRARTPDLAMLREAADALSTSGARLEYARALIDLGAAIRRSGRPAQARDALRRGYELATRCGAEALSGRAMQELVAAGARPRSGAFRGVESLTASERRVAELAADGMTNRAIAQALFVTEKTVETHLRHIYSKLDITSRAQLPAQLSRGAEQVSSEASTPRHISSPTARLVPLLAA
jgi:DNA-binding NarL/FixJ family response regulator